MNRFSSYVGSVYDPCRGALPNVLVLHVKCGSYAACELGKRSRKKNRAGLFKPLSCPMAVL